MPAPATVIATAICYSGQGTPEQGVRLEFVLVEAPAGDGESFDSTAFSVLSDVDGGVTVTLLRAGKYKGRRGVGPWQLFETPDAATMVLPQLNGADLT